MKNWLNFKKSQKGFALSIIVVIFALLAIGGGTFVYTNKKVEAPVYTPETIVNMPTTTSGVINKQNDDLNSVRPPSANGNETPVTFTNVDVAPPLGNSTLRIICALVEMAETCKPYTDPSNPTLNKVCSMAMKCNTEGVNSARSDFYLITENKKVKILVDIETRLRFVMGPNETLKKWADFYPLIKPYSPEAGGMPFSATIYGDWVNDTTFKANWIKWTIG